MTARIVGLTRYPQKDEPGVSLSEMIFLEGIGIQGDFHQGNERQVSLLSADARRWMEAQTLKGLCFERFRENMLVDGRIEGASETSFEALESGTLLSAGSAVLRIGAQSKRCHTECDLFSSNSPCRLSGCVRFADVAQSGIARIGEAVSIRSLDSF